MSQIFSIHRFSKLFKRELSINNAKILKPIIITIALYAVFWIFIEHVLGNSTNVGYPRLFFFGTILYFFIILIPTALYNSFNDKRKGIINAMLPASSLEKFVTKWISCVFVYPIIILVLLFGIDMLLSWIYGITSFSDSIYELKTKIISQINLSDASFIISKNLITTYIISLIIGTFSYQAFFILGIHFFKSHRISKTILSLIVLSSAVSMLSMLFSFPEMNQFMLHSGETQNINDLLSNGTLNSMMTKGIILQILELLVTWFLTFRIIKTHKFY